MRRLSVIVVPIAAVMLAGCGGSDAPVATSEPSRADTATTTATASESSAASASSGVTNSTDDTGTSASSSPSSVPTQSTAVTGSSTAKDPRTIIANATASANKADTARVQATGRDDDGSWAIDIRGKVNGGNQELVMDSPAEGKATVRTVDGTSYLKADKEFWAAQKAPASEQQRLSGKWVKVPAGETEFDRYTIKSLLDELHKETGANSANSANTSVTSAQEGGKPVLRLVAKGSSSTTTLVVTDDDKNLPVALTETGDDGGDAKFSEWNEVAPFSAPASRDVVEAPTE